MVSLVSSHAWRHVIVVVLSVNADTPLVHLVHVRFEEVPLDKVKIAQWTGIRPLVGVLSIDVIHHDVLSTGEELTLWPIAPVAHDLHVFLQSCLAKKIIS